MKRKRSILKHFVIPVILLLMNACCTKRACDGPTPVIPVSFQNFDPAQLQNITLYVVNDTTFALLDSISEWRDSKIEEYTFLYHPFNHHSYIIKTPVSSDTIKHVSYETYEQTILCNGCFPTGHTNSTFIAFRDFMYQYKDIIYMNTDTLIIKKYQ